MVEGAEGTLSVGTGRAIDTHLLQVCRRWDSCIHTAPTGSLFSGQTAGRLDHWSPQQTLAPAPKRERSTRLLLPLQDGRVLLSLHREEPGILAHRSQGTKESIAREEHHCPQQQVSSPRQRAIPDQNTGNQV